MKPKTQLKAPANKLPNRCISKPTPRSSELLDTPTLNQIPHGIETHSTQPRHKPFHKPNINQKTTKTKKRKLLKAPIGRLPKEVAKNLQSTIILPAKEPAITDEQTDKNIQKQIDELVPEKLEILPEEIGPKISYQVKLESKNVDFDTNLKFFIESEDDEDNGTDPEVLLEKLGLDDESREKIYEGPFDPFKAITYKNENYIEVDDNYLAQNLHWEPTENADLIADWRPRIIKDYKLVKKLYLDIETTGLDPTTNRVVMTGIMTDGPFTGIDEETAKQLAKGYIVTAEKVDDDDAEKFVLLRLLKALHVLDPDIITTHNGIKFDFPFLAHRMTALGIKHNIHILEKEKMVTAASFFGKPIRYRPVYLKAPNARGYVENDGSFTQIVDTLPLAAQVDKIKANMLSYSLKYLAHYTGSRTEKRLELPYEKIKEYWYSQEPRKLDLLREYLYYDLADQKMVSDYFVPTIWYQQMFFPMAVQELAMASPARKWNALLESFYKPYYNRRLPDKTYYQRPHDEIKRKYDGALVDCAPGLYEYFFKIDVSSLYPSLILRYGLYGAKDPLKVVKAALSSFRELRYVFKGLAGDDPKSVQEMSAFHQLEAFFAELDFDNISEEELSKFAAIDGSLKVCINGLYGFYGVGKYPFNNISGAALTTAYGRVLMREMRKVAEQFCHIINVDTDGLYLQPKTIDEIDPTLLDDYALDQYAPHPKSGEFVPVFDPERPDYINPTFVWAQVQSVLPDRIKIDLEECYPDGVIYAPKMKNYIYWTHPSKSEKTKGVYRKRNRTGLQKEFPITYIYKHAFDGPDAADSYFNEVVSTLSQNTAIEQLDQKILEKVTIRQRIPTSSKKLPAYGMGEPGSNIAFYWGSIKEYTPKGNIRKKLGRFPIRVVITDEGEYKPQLQDIPENIKPEDVYTDLNTDWYVADVIKLRTQIDEILNEQNLRKTDPIYDSVPDSAQMSLPIGVA